MRIGLVPLLAVVPLAAATPAAAVVPLASVDGEFSGDDLGAGPVLAGDRVLWTRVRGGTLTLRAAPPDGGPAADSATLTLPGGRIFSETSLAASASRVGVVAGTQADRRGSSYATQLFTGPPAGPLESPPGSLGPRHPDARADAAFVVGDDVITLERAGRPFGRPYRLVQRHPVERVLPLPARAIAATVTVAGDRAAVAVRRRGRPAPSHVVVLDRRSGEEVRRVGGLPADLLDLALDADGGLAYAGESRIGYMAPGATGWVRFRAEAGPVGLEIAGGLVAYVADVRPGGARRVRVVRPPAKAPEDPSAPVRALFEGPLSSSVRTLDFDGRHVAWATGGCRVVAAVAGPSRRTLPPGPCLRSEIGISTLGPRRLRSANPHYRVGIRCIAAPGRACAVQTLLDGYRRWRVPAGAERQVRIPMGRRFARRFTPGRRPIPLIRVLEGARRGPWHFG